MGNYFVYIVTNPAHTVLYIGITNELKRRLVEHYENRGKPTTFAGKFYCHKLIYFERFQYAHHAIEREKQLKGWSRNKKEALIATLNPNWDELNKSAFL
jgi:putative endonuclease